MDLIDTLKRQHRVLEEVAGEVESALRASAQPELTATLNRFVDLLRAHLHLEATHFYPQLLELAHGDQRRMRTVQLFSDNMQRVAEGLTPFVRRFAGKELINLNEFAREWRTVLSALNRRIAAEERSLQPLFRAMRRRTVTGEVPTQPGVPFHKTKAW